MQTIGKRLAYIRKQKGYTQASLARAIEVSRGVISNIEYDQNEPLPVVTNALCTELHINAAWLLDGVGQIEPENSPSATFDELMRVCATLSEAQQLHMLETARSLQKYWDSPQELGPETKALKEQLQRPCADIIRDAAARVGSQSTGSRRSEPEREK